MKERPILFSAPMVNAILNGTKIVTRRTNGLDMVNLNPEARTSAHYVNDGYWDLTMHDGTWHGLIKCPYGQVGDQLWVRETHAIVPRTAYAHSEGVHQVHRYDDNHDAAIFRAGWNRSQGGIKWRPSIQMPRWASRIQLEITGVRVERLNDISPQDSIAEGIQVGDFSDIQHDISNGISLVDRYKELWETINGAGSWDANPWVWVIEFKVINS